MKKSRDIVRNLKQKRGGKDNDKHAIESQAVNNDAGLSLDGNLIGKNNFQTYETPNYKLVSTDTGSLIFFRFCPYLHYTGVFRHLNKTCLKLTALQVPSCQMFFKINFKLGMDLSPSPACDRSIFS